MCVGLLHTGGDGSCQPRVVAGRGGGAGRRGNVADTELLLFFRTLLLNGTARQAVLSVVAGRTLMADGEIDGVDLGYWRRRGQELFDKMKAAYTLRDASRRTTAELFPPVYARVEH